MYLRLISLIVLILAQVQGTAQKMNPNWKPELNSALEKYLHCSDDRECDQFLGAALKTVYMENSFYSPQLKRYLTPSEIASELQTTKKWNKLGYAYQQDILRKAQELANAKKAVLAVYQNALGIGHVVLILPGELQSSGSWGLHVPNVASFHPIQRENSFIEKGLSYAFNKGMIKDIVLYSLN